jgi:hypothetical protein
MVLIRWDGSAEFGGAGLSKGTGASDSQLLHFLVNLVFVKPPSVEVSNH